MRWHDTGSDFGFMLMGKRHTHGAGGVWAVEQDSVAVWAHWVLLDGPSEMQHKVMHSSGFYSPPVFVSDCVVIGCWLRWWRRGGLPPVQAIQRDVRLCRVHHVFEYFVATTWVGDLRRPCVRLSSGNLIIPSPFAFLKGELCQAFRMNGLYYVT